MRSILCMKSMPLPLFTLILAALLPALAPAQTAPRSEGARGNSDAEMVKLIKPDSSAEIEAVADFMSQLPPPAK